MEAEQRDDSNLGRVLDDRFELLSVLGKGGVGVVYRALQHSIRREVAIKVLRTHAATDPTARERFLHEARVASQLRHPHAITVFDFGSTPDGLLYLVMELLDGHSLSTELKANGRLAVERVVRLLRQSCSAVEYAHERHVLHRDLKPDNIFLLAEPGPQGDFVKVLDFGLARVVDPECDDDWQASSGISGTPGYLSPEQIMSDPLDARSDVYALGVTAFQLLAGRLPFAHQSVFRAMQAHLEAPVPTMAELGVRHVPAAIEQVVRKAMAKAPDDRYQSAAAFSEALASALGRGETEPAPHLAPTEEPASSEAEALDHTLEETYDCPRPAARFEPGEFATVSTAYGKSAPSERPGRVSRRRKWLWALALVALAPTAWWLARDQGKPEASLPPPAVSSMAPEQLVAEPSVSDVDEAPRPKPAPAPALPEPSPPPAPVPAPAVVEPDVAPAFIEVVSEPAGATVKVAGRPVGKTPLEIARPTEDERVEILILARRYRPERRLVSAETDRVAVRLVKTSRRKKRPAKPRAASSFTGTGIVE